MSTYANPPKIRGYVDHWPHAAQDNKPKWNRKFDTYFDHWPQPGDGPVQTTRTIINSYVDHFPQAGDLAKGNQGGAWPGGKIPNITSLAPNTVVHPAPATPIVITGTSFVSGAVVRVGGTVVTSTVNSATQISATIPASLLTVAVGLSVTVENPNTELSNTVTFTVT